MSLLIYDNNVPCNKETSPEYLYPKGSTVLVQKNHFARTGYIFAEWNTAADGSGLSYDPDDDLVIGSIDVTLYAQWMPI